MLTIGSLFSGVGGIEFGFESTGQFKTIWNCENDPYASAVLKKHWAEVPNLGDITKVKWEEIERPDILTGGFPCQDISIAGKGKGIKKGTRSGLWSEYIKAIRMLRPKYAVIENVSMLALRGLDIVLVSLAEAGYDAEWGIVSAREVGAPHKRERLFIIAYLPSERCVEHEGQSKEVQSGRNKGLQRKESKQSELSEPLHCVTTPNTNSQRLKEHGQVLKQEIRRNELLEVEGSVDASDPRSKRIQRERKKEIPELPGFSWCENIRRVEDLFNRPDIPEPLIRGGNDGIPNRVDRTKCIGNAVVPQVAKVIAEKVLKMEYTRGKLK